MSHLQHFRPYWRVPLFIGIVIVITGVLFLGNRSVARAAVTTNISINGTGTGRTFDGIGAISGGGGNTRLLIDYPEPYRSQILDYLFKPGYGADLQILKVEVGGDTNSTDGSECSYMHTASTQDLTCGYEWWLMQQAKARNPNIKLYALAWGAPGWIGSGNFWSQDMVNYYVNWIKAAKTTYNLTIDYVGGWNEKGYNISWYESFKQALQANGLSTKLVGADSDWSIVNDMSSNSAFNNAIDIVGVHYPCGYLSSETSCNTSSTAQALNKPLWASENGSEDYNSGAAAMARADNRDYIDGKMTATINWPIVAGLYPNLPFATDALMVDNQPWSGYYSVGKQLWVTAQTTQFTQPGWRYIDSASGYLGGSNSNGSYVTLRSPTTSDYSTIIETMDATAAQTVNINVTNGLSTGTVHVWSTNVNSSNANDYFVKQSDITPSNGAYSLTIQPGYVYSITTTTGQGKGTATSPAQGSLTLPYTDTFESETPSQDAKYFTDMNGSFEIVNCTGGHTGQCLRQMAPTAPINWEDPSDPYSLMGDLSWGSYTVSTDALLEQSGYVEVMGRVSTQSRPPTNINAYYLRVTDTGNWSILRNDTNGNLTTLNSGTVSALGTNTWHNLSLGFQGTTITAKIDNTTVGSATDSTYSAGQVGIGVSSWQTAQFDNFSVTSNPADPGAYDDESSAFTYSGNGWTHGGCSPNCYGGTNSWDNTANDSVSVSFVGTQIQFYGVKDPGHGIGAVSIDGGSETQIDFYSAIRAGNQLMWTSPVLPQGTHKLTLRVTGTKNASSSNTWVVPDAVIIPAAGGTYDDQSLVFSYNGSGWTHGGCTPNCYNSTNSWDNTTNDSVSVSFVGTQIQFYGVKDPGHGIGAVSIDGGSETQIDFYSATRAGDQLMWTSPVLAQGIHTFTLRVTGTKNASSSNTWVVPDAVNIPSSPPSVGSGWTQCASENGTCSFSGTAAVAYGVNGQYVYGNFTNGTSCSNGVFGDPFVGVVKSCFVSTSFVSPAPGVWTQCASENGICFFTGTMQVAYGNSGHYNYGTFTNGTACNNSVFPDPDVGVVKACFTAPTSTSSSTSTTNDVTLR
jgi:Glycosyl hydrolase family 59